MDNVKIRGMEPGDATSWRQALGDAIKAQREARGRTLRDVSRRAKVQIADVESWERGATVPNAEQWKALTNGISRSMSLYTETWRKARAECDRERETITRSIEVHANGTKQNNHTAPITTKLGDKLASAGVAPPVKPGSLLPPIVSQPTPIATPPTPPPDARTVNPGQAVAYHAPAVRPAPTIEAARRGGQTAREQMGIPEERGPDGRRLPPPVPAGGRSRAMIAKKTAFVRELILARPGIRTNGSDSVVEAVRLKFGVGISPEIVEAMRAELGRQRARPFDGVSTDKARAFVETAAKELEAANAQADKREAATLYTDTKPGAAVVGLSELAADRATDDDIAAAVKLILEAIPNLQTFTIDVDENGEASVDYQVREVKITTRTGSLKVGRK